jgi:hypothetical protein
LEENSEDQDNEEEEQQEEEDDEEEGEEEEEEEEDDENEKESQDNKVDESKNSINYIDAPKKEVLKKVVTEKAEEIDSHKIDSCSDRDHRDKKNFKNLFIKNKKNEKGEKAGKDKRNDKKKNDNRMNYKEEEEDDEYEENNNDEENKESSRNEMEEQEESVKNSELSLAFACQKHISEEYSYYNPKNRRLYCSRCLLSENLECDMEYIKPLKKCFPEILQNFQDMLNEVEVNKNLIENKKKDFEIRKENCKAKVYSLYKKFEINVDEIIEELQDFKKKYLKDFEEKGEILVDTVQKQEKLLNEKYDYFSAILEQVNNLKKNSSEPEEEIFSFFFANQEKIFQNLKEQKQSETEIEFKEKNIFKEFREKIKKEKEQLYNLALEKMIDNLYIKLQKNQTKENNGNSLNLNAMNKSIFTKKIESQKVTNISNNYNTFLENKETNSKDYFVEKIQKYCNLSRKRHVSVDIHQYNYQKLVNRPQENYVYNKLQTNNQNLDKKIKSPHANIVNSYYKTIDRSSSIFKDKLESKNKNKFFDLKFKNNDFGSHLNTVINFNKAQNYYKKNFSKNSNATFNFREVKGFNKNKNNTNNSFLKSFNLKNSSLMSIK